MNFIITFFKIGNTATSLAENPIVQEAVKPFFRNTTNYVTHRPDEAINSVKTDLDTYNDGQVGWEDIKETATNVFDANGDGIVDASDAVHDVIQVASDVQDVVGTVGSDAADIAVDTVSVGLDFLDEISKWGA